MALYSEDAMRRALAFLDEYHQQYPIWTSDKDRYNPFQQKEPEIGCVYLLTNRISNKRYVGQSKLKTANGKEHGLEGRWKQHVSNANSGKKSCKLLEKAIRDSGPDNFDRQVIDHATVGFDLDRLEEHYIRTLCTRYPNGYNIITTKQQGARKGSKR